MEEKKVTEPVEITKPEDKTFEGFKGTNQDVANMIAKAKKEAIEEMLKNDLGVEDVKSAKEGLKKFKEIQEAQKTDAEKLAERNAQLEKERDEALKEVRNSKIERITDNVLKELNIDAKYSKTVLKLANFADIQDISSETLKPIIEKTISEELPILINEEKTKIGVDKPDEKMPKSGYKDYLDKKYANNPYYKN